MKLEIHIISNRPKLDNFIAFWNNVDKTNNNVKLQILTSQYDSEEYSLKNGIEVQIIKEDSKIKPQTTFMNQAFYRNYLLCYAESPEFILFYDDWQKPSKQLLLEHLKYLEKGYSVCGQKIDCDRSGQNCQPDSRNTGILRQCGYGYFWTANASCSYADILKVNGFDNCYNGGSAGEDYDMGMRIERLGSKFLYNPNALSYHYSHDHLRRTGRIGGTAHKQSHNLSPYKNIPEYGHNGDWDLMESEQFELWWDGPIKYWKCKKCGEIGICDSIQVYNYNLKNNIIRVKNGLQEVKNKLCQTKE